PGLDASELDRLTRTALEIPQSAAPVVLVRAPLARSAFTATVVRGPANARDERDPDIGAPTLGLYAFRLDTGERDDVIIRMRRREELPPARPTRVRVQVLVPEARGKLPRLLSTDIDVTPNGKPVEIRWSGGALRAI